MSTINVPPAIVPVLRTRLLKATSDAAARLSRITRSGRVGQEYGYRDAHARLEAAHALLAQTGVVAPATDSLVALEIDASAHLAYEVLKVRHESAAREAEEREHESRPASTNSLLDLGTFLDALRIAIAAYER